ncbi:hypothetical protein PIROE2DRAFT_52124 [Piromyces sp. E2]|nr:hypothetical protein PIROE2DRAFT_52124 [Piromyces sp. E2]|eukprot:OUM59957.1 hypothetical protein PIROE2DRAFT_52124 [Piromyces sp. E2]
MNNENVYGETPLFYACYNGNENLVRYLIKHGAKINKENKDGETPLFYACYNGNVNLVKYLVKKKQKLIK